MTRNGYQYTTNPTGVSLERVDATAYHFQDRNRGRIPPPPPPAENRRHHRLTSGTGDAECRPPCGTRNLSIGRSVLTCVCRLSPHVQAAISKPGAPDLTRIVHTVGSMLCRLRVGPISLVLSGGSARGDGKNKISSPHSSAFQPVRFAPSSAPSTPATTNAPSRRLRLAWPGEQVRSNRLLPAASRAHQIATWPQSWPPGRICPQTLAPHWHRSPQRPRVTGDA